jgi:hypothetical protein
VTAAKRQQPCPRCGGYNPRCSRCVSVRLARKHGADTWYCWGCGTTRVFGDGHSATECARQSERRIPRGAASPKITKKRGPETEGVTSPSSSGSAVSVRGEVRP